MYSNNSPQAIIWDMDGVLVDNSEAHFYAWVETCRYFTNGELTLSRTAFDVVFGMRNAETVPRLFGAERATPRFIAEVSEAKEEFFRKSIKGKTEPLAGAWAWLEYWQQAGIKQAVASSAPKLNIDAILAEIQAEDFFDVLVSGESPQISHSKAAPEIFLEAARQLDVDPAHCRVIEDAVVGVQAARAAGMRCLAVTTTHSSADLAAADWIAHNLAELPPEKLAAA